MEEGGVKVNESVISGASRTIRGDDPRKFDLVTAVDI